jgi:hypothetical protein
MLKIPVYMSMTLPPGASGRFRRGRNGKPNGVQANANGNRSKSLARRANGNRGRERTMGANARLGHG